MPDEVTRLREMSPRLLEHELFVCTAGELGLLQALGEPASNNAFSRTGPKMTWNVRWSCGRVASFHLDPLKQRLTGYIDEPDVEHVLRHLALEPGDLWLLEEERPEVFAAQCRAPDRAFELWRQDDNGVNELVRGGLTEDDANCWRAELERSGHKQFYWVQRAADAPPPPVEPEVVLDPEPEPAVPFEAPPAPVVTRMARPSAQRARLDRGR